MLKKFLRAWDLSKITEIVREETNNPVIMKFILTACQPHRGVKSPLCEEECALIDTYYYAMALTQGYYAFVQGVSDYSSVDAEKKIINCLNDMLLKYHKIPVNKFSRYFTNRLMYYGKIIDECSNYEEFLNKMLLTFQIILINDIGEKTYFELSSDRPLPLSLRGFTSEKKTVLAFTACEVYHNLITEFLNKNKI